jgi:hypothetical protein
MIHLSREMADLVPGLMGIVIAIFGWFMVKRMVNRTRSEYFFKHGRYPGERTPAE